MTVDIISFLFTRMLTKKLNGTVVGSGTQIDFTAPGATATDDGSTRPTVLRPVITSPRLRDECRDQGTSCNAEDARCSAGAGFVLEFVFRILKLGGGANALTETTDNMAVKYTDGSAPQFRQAIECTGFIDQTAPTNHDSRSED